MKITGTILLLLSFLSTISAQDRFVDSLQAYVDTTSNVYIKAENLVLLAWAIEGSDSERALRLSTEAYELERGGIVDPVTVEALKGTGYFHTNLGNYPEAIEVFYKALAYLKSPSFKATEMNTIGFKAIYDDRDTEQLLYGEVYRHMGHLYGEVGNYEEQLLKYKQALDIYETTNHEQGAANALWNVGDAYNNLNQPDSALIYAKKGLLYYLKPDLQFYVNSYRGEVYNVIGYAHFLNNDYAQAEEAYKKAIESNLLFNNQRNLCETELAMSEMYKAKGDYLNSLTYAEKALSYAKEIGLPSHILESYLQLSSAYKNLKNPEEEFRYLRLTIPLQDSLNRVEKNNLIKYHNSLFKQNQQLEAAKQEREAELNRNRSLALLAVAGFSILIAFLLFRNNRQKQKSNVVLSETLTNLKSTQAQLIQSEKMASLGELTAGIAHEIQNPLNFVNNFSDVSSEMIDEMHEEIAKGDLEEVKLISNDIKQNLNKISHHGNRASSIVKGMLDHSRVDSGEKVPTDINALCDEYLRLSYHGLRAKDSSFNCGYETHFDDSIPLINVVPQDIGRVLLNIINNAFYACSARRAVASADRPALSVPRRPKPLAKDRAEESVSASADRSVSTVSSKASATEDANYKPLVTITTKREGTPLGAGGGEGIAITITDNGTGMSQETIDKVFQPFFTTKPTGQGTGLGMSISYDIITNGHAGTLSVASEEGKGTTFTIALP